MVAKDIRDLQLWTGHCGGLRRRLVRARRLARLVGVRLVLFFLGFPRRCRSISSGLSMLAIMPVATRV
jgi:hypothetical protein